MSKRRYNSDTLHRLYEIGGSDLALRYRDIAENSSIRNDISNKSNYNLKVVSLRFFNGGRSAPKEADRPFKTRFSQGSAKYIYFQLTMRNPWQYAEYPYNLTARYYYPDDTLMGEIKSSFKTNPKWDTFWHTRAWGWEEAGNWTPGDYRVEIYIDNEHRITETFSILNIAEDKHKGGPTDIETTMRVEGLYRQLAVALSRIYKETDPQKASHYRAKAAQRDSRETNNAFSQQMLNSLEDILYKI